MAMVLNGVPVATRRRDKAAALAGFAVSPAFITLCGYMLFEHIKLWGKYHQKKGGGGGEVLKETAVKGGQRGGLEIRCYDTTQIYPDLKRKRANSTGNQLRA
ncbi:hypothetical protein ACJX0J_018449 [Zea mays]